MDKSIAQSKADHNAWRNAVKRVSALANAKLPDALHGRLERATALVLDGAVCLEEDGHTCQVHSSTDHTWYAVNGHCVCEDAQRNAPDGYCKHRLAKALYRRASELMHTPLKADLDPEGVCPPPVQGIPAQYLVHIQGKLFVLYSGLLQMAHARGLVELTATWTYNDAGLSMAEAVATFSDGRHFRESGDATPDNVTKKVAPHFRRVALTRAKARALRDALRIDLVAVEELGEN